MPSSIPRRPATAVPATDTWGLPLLLAIGLAYRLATYALFPVLHDEIIVIARGMSQLSLSGDPVDLLFRVPETNSNGITPLWWWIQLLPTRLLGETSKLGLRLVPLLLGLAGTALAYHAGRRLGGSRSAWFAGLLWAAGDLILYTNSKGDFVASFTGVAALALLLDLLPDGDPSPRWRAALWPSLILLTYLGHGLILWASYAIYLLVRHVTTSPAGETWRSWRVARLLAMVLLPLMPSLAWALAAQALLFREGIPLVTDIGPVTSVWDHLWRLTWGYGTVTKTYMVGAWYDALYVYRDFAVWPTLALVAVPGTCALLLHASRAWLKWRSCEVGQTSLDLLPACLVAPTLGVLVAKGAVAARFHLLYLPIAFPFIAAVVDGWIRSLERGEWRRFAAAGLAQTAFVAWTCSWSLLPRSAAPWQTYAPAALLAATVVALLALSRRPRFLPRLGRGASALVTLVVLASTAWQGPLVWARRLASEPEPNKRLPRAVTSFPNVDLQLARTSVEREIERERVRRAAAGRPPDDGAATAVAIARARPLLWRALERNPDDSTTLIEVGVAMLNFSESDRARVASLFDAYEQRHPGDLAVRAIRARLSGAEPRNAPNAPPH